MLMCSKNWLGFPEVTQQELTAERDWLDQLQELSADGDLWVFPMESFLHCQPLLFNLWTSQPIFVTHEHIHHILT